MLQHLGQVAKSLDLPFGKREMTYNSRLAQELGLWAETEGRGKQFHKQAFHAYFAEGKNLAAKDVLLEISEKSGLEQRAAEDILLKRSFSAKVDADWHLSREMGITAVPTFVINGSTLTGAQPYGDLVRFIQNSAEDVAPLS